MQMTILISGATGLIGSNLIQELIAQNHNVRVLTRNPKRSENQFYWNPAKAELDRSALVDVDAVIHLAGESIAARRWSDEVKRNIKASRINGTNLLVTALQDIAKQGGKVPRIFLSASATGIYGARGDEVLTETSKLGAGFLAEIGIAWEAEARKAALFGARVVLMRFGVVLSAEGGALREMLLPFKLGLGGKLGSGKQYFSWIDLRDAVRAIIFCLENDSISGPVNFVAPTAVTNSEFTKALAKTLKRPAIFAVPAIILRLIFGEMAQSLLLEGVRVKPEVLIRNKFSFSFPEINPSLASLFSVKNKNQ